MRRFFLLFPLAGFIWLTATLSGCQPRPSIVSFMVRPKGFCSFPQTIVVQWQAAGQTIRLDADPRVIAEEVAATGSRDVTVSSDPTTFTLTAAVGSTTATRTESVSRLTGSRFYALGGLAECQGSYLVRTIDVLDDEYSRDVVVRRIRNTGTTQLEIQSPGGATTIPPLGTGAIPRSPLVGTWTMRTLPLTPCNPLEGGSGLIGVEVEIGCP